MDHLAKLVAALALAYASTAHSGYAELRPPTGWTAGTASTAATYAKAANETWTTTTVRTTASLNVGGRAVSVPASMRLSANAGQYITGRIGAGLLGGPAGFALTVGLLALPSVIDWYTQQNAVEWDSALEKWVVKGTEVDRWCEVTPSISSQIASCLASMNYDDSANSGWKGTGTSTGVTMENGVCKSHYEFIQTANSGQVIEQTGLCVEFAPRQVPREVNRPAHFETEVKPALNPLPIGDPFLNEPKLPFPLPVQQPVINPNPAGQPQPLFVPTGNPVKNPNYDPTKAPSPTNQPYLQPGVRVVPTPTPDKPWQVDVQPVDKPVPNPTPSPEPVPEPVPNPGDPDPAPSEDRDPDLCEKNPDILACQKVVLKDLDAKPLANADKTMAINPDTGWGPSGGTCPPPRTASVMGVSISMPFTMLCDFASAIKPLFIAMAWLSAAMAFLGLGRKD